MSFNWEIYRELNPDLLKAGIKTKEQFENHYKLHGIREKRNIFVHQVYPGFNPVTYRNNYSDLKNLNDIQASLHWLRYGKREGRNYKNVSTKKQLPEKNPNLVKDKILFIINNDGLISNNYDYLNIIKNNSAIKLNFCSLEMVRNYRKVILIGCDISMKEVSDIVNFCCKNKIEIVNTNKDNINNVFKNIVHTIIDRSINHWNKNRCISKYFSDDIKLSILKRYNIPITITPNNNLPALISSTSVVNNFNNKFMAIILILKNRRQRFDIFIKYLKMVKQFNTYCELIIVEDNSNSTIDVKLLNGIDYKYYLVNTGVGWSRTKLINYGLSKTVLQLSLFCDIDFIFSPDFLSKFIKNFNTFNFSSLGLCIPVFETHTSFDNNNDNNIVRRTNENYGHVLIVSTNKIKILGGFDCSINNHGFEERELWIRCLFNRYEFCFINDIYNDIYVLHLSHDEKSRGKRNNPDDLIRIVNKLKQNIHIPFVHSLQTIKSIE